MKMKSTTTRPPGPRRPPRRMIRPLHARAAAREEEIDDYEGGAEPNMKFSHALIVVLVLHVLAVGGVFAFNTLKSSHSAADKRKAPVAEKQETRPAAVSEASEKSVPPAAAKPEAKTSSIPPAAGITHTVAAGDTLTKIAAQHKTSVEAIEQANGLEATKTIRVGQVLKISSKPAVETKPVPVKESTPAARTTEAKPSPKTVTPAASSKAAPQAETAKAAPVAATASQTAKPAAKEETKPAASAGTYTVAKGDNPYSIAKKLKVSYSELLKVNKIEDPTKLQIGQKLTIP